MRVLLVSTLKRKVSPETTASRSRVIFQIGQELVKKGHTVDLLGTKDSHIPGVGILSVIEKAFIELPPFENSFYVETSYLVALEKKIEELAKNYDVVHSHTYPEFFNLYATERISTPMVTTLHAQPTPEYDHVLSLFPHANLVSISKAHKSLFKKTKINWTVYNGIDTKLFSFEENKDDYLLWLGRLGRAKNKDGTFFDAKGARWAIALAEATGSRLLLSGNVEDREFYEKDVLPHLNDKIQWVGGISSEQPLAREEVIKLMQKAKAFLMPINWEEPFGLVIAEAMACGTPVIAFDRGAVSELIIDGKTGFVISPDEGVEGLKKALSKLNQITPQNCREHVEQNFTVEKMGEAYEKIYGELLDKSS